MQPPEPWRRLGIAAGAVAGAALGAKLLFVLDYWTATRAAGGLAWLHGKTIVGGLLGGLVGVELAKRSVGWTRATGDSFALPVLAGLAIGRLGCQLSGVTDLTYGLPTTLPWGLEQGDGVARHPVAFYEVLALAALAPLVRAGPPNARDGDRFRLLMVAYLAFRLAIDFLKPPHGPAAAGVPVPDAWAGLSAIQWACVAGLAYYARDVRRWLAPGAAAAAPGR